MPCMTIIAANGVLATVEVMNSFMAVSASIGIPSPPSHIGKENKSRSMSLIAYGCEMANSANLETSSHHALSPFWSHTLGG